MCQFGMIRVLLWPYQCMWNARVRCARSDSSDGRGGTASSAMSEPGVITI